jgi:predicted LPLAT superfamily acyltransferase/glycosyltransferase involved in cell wall biosynthesis
MILRIRLCIPTYNNPTSIEGVILNCLRETAFPVLVVDDGSEPRVDPQHPEIRSALEFGRLEILRHSTNLGKGVALQNAFRVSVASGFTHLFSIDGDGQHLTTEVPKMIEAARLSPWALIIGHRKFASETVPKISKFGRNFSNFWVKFQTQTPVEDSQSGFRIYPLFHVQNLKFFTKRFDFEIEVLIRLLWKKVEIREVLIEVFYPKPEDRVSHFDKFRDNVRISTLNVILVVLSLLKSHRSPLKAALAVGFGVWMGCTPFYGFHSLLAAGVSLLLQLNFIYLWLGTQISLPPLAAILALGSVKIGKHFVERGFFLQWLSGSLVLGAVLGFVFGASVYLILLSANREMKSKANWSGKSRGGKFGNAFLIQITRLGGLPAAHFCLYFVVPYFYLFAPKARRASQEYWQQLRPEAGFWVRQGLVLKHLHRFALVLLDRVYFGFHSNAFTVRSHGAENILESVAQKKGVILVGAHVGGWELASGALKLQGRSHDFTAVQYEAEGMTTTKVRGSDSYDPSKLSPFDLQSGPPPILKIREILASGKPVGMMVDRPFGNHVELVPFFGKLAPFDSTPFRIASSCKASVVFTFGFRGEGNRYELYASKPEQYPMYASSARDQEGYDGLRRFAHLLEEKMREFPEQWFNFFPFWSAVPVPPVAVDSGTLGATEGRARSHLAEELRTQQERSAE